MAKSPTTSEMLYFWSTKSYIFDQGKLGKIILKSDACGNHVILHDNVMLIMFFLLLS